jgi:hypothetical protein
LLYKKELTNCIQGAALSEKLIVAQLGSFYGTLRFVAVFRLSCNMQVFYGDDHPDDGGSKRLRNVGKFLPDYTAQQPRRQPPSLLFVLRFVQNS